ncbi:hypothetical protein ACFYM0_25040 [Streptomyces sp. NPDC006487]|uniref:hypothetical protein n=1 Tax=Streptomyces sp. NPDC006487 TaxID=3364748 RepID=UPI00367E7740
MRRGHVGRAVGHAGAWTLATGAAVTLSWWGVHSVMSGTAYDPPLAVPLAAQPLSSSTHRAQPPEPTPSPALSPSPSASVSTAPASPSASAKSSAPPTPRSQRQAHPGENVKAYSVSGGRVVFDLGAAPGELVSATPLAGWRMQVWKQPFWIRVTFTRDGREVSVFCTWHDHPPLVEIVDP